MLKERRELRAVWVGRKGRLWSAAQVDLGWGASRGKGRVDSQLPTGVILGSRDRLLVTR